jgi:hypothetical protein
MAFRRPLFVVLAFVAALIACGDLVVRAQGLQRLTVTQLTLSADTNAPRVETPFHLIVTAHVRERITELDNVDLPILAELELLGDEHTVIATSGGTTYRETIDVVAHHSGPITIAPVTLDAVDARDGRPKRYSSNSLTLNVLGITSMPAAPAPASLPWVPIIVAFGSALFIWSMARRNRRTLATAPASVAVTLPTPVPVQRDDRARARGWCEQLAGNPTRAGAMHVRASVRRAVGASETETLADVLRRPLAQDPGMRSLLRALERAGFTHDDDVTAAIRATIAQLEEMAR